MCDCGWRITTGPGTHGRDLTHLLGQGASAAGLTILRRILAYGRKVLRWEEPLDAMRDSRRRPQIATRTDRSRGGGDVPEPAGQPECPGADPAEPVLGAVARAGDAVGRLHRAGLFADGRVEDVRASLHQVYSRLKRMKALEPPAHGLMRGGGGRPRVHRQPSGVAVRGACQRMMHTQAGDVGSSTTTATSVLRLVGQDLSLMLDAEPVRPGEDELAASRAAAGTGPGAGIRGPSTWWPAMRLYANTEWFQFLLSRRQACPGGPEGQSPRICSRMPERCSAFCRPAWMSPTGNRRRRCWDSDGFTSWPELAAPVRVVRSLETCTVRRQLDERERRTDFGLDVGDHAAEVAGPDARPW